MHDLNRIVYPFSAAPGMMPSVWPLAPGDSDVGFDRLGVMSAVEAIVGLADGSAGLTVVAGASSRVLPALM